jgi:hypothetical protein
MRNKPALFKNGPNSLTFSDNFESKISGEQTYCRKWILDKMPKIVLGHNDKKSFRNTDLVQNAEFFFVS